MSWESIEHLVFREEPVEVRKYPMYRSKFSKQVREEMRRVKECHRTFGLPKEMLTPEPLKKGTRKVVRPHVEKWSPPEGTTRRLSPVPRREDWTRPLQKERPYFPLRNALAVARSAPPAAAARSRTWDTGAAQCRPVSHLLEPVFLRSQGLGKVPKYLEKRKKETAEARERREAEEAKRRAQQEVLSGVRVVSEDERDQLIQGLKSAWTEASSQYRLLPLVVDSTPMIKKKRHLELSLERLEKNIDLLERNKIIYVTDLKNDNLT